jgi:hypothetical protein
MDLNVKPKHDVPLWNETRWVGCWCPEPGVGLYLHMGRMRGNLDMWRAQVASYLPEGALCVDRFWGRNGREDGARIGGLDLEIADGGWQAAFDGVGQLTSTKALAAAPRGASAPARAMQFDVRSTAVTAVWDMYADRGEERLIMANDTHIQQAGETSGWLEVGDARYGLEGISFLDHSSGTRDFDPWTRHTYMMIVGPEWTAHLLGMGESDSGNPAPWGAFIRRDGARDTIAHLEFPLMTDATGSPTHSELVFEIGSGERFEFHAELVHTLPMTITEENDNINGVDWETPGDPVIFSEGNGRLTSPAGEVLHCFHERSARRSMLAPAHQLAGAAKG